MKNLVLICIFFFVGSSYVLAGDSCQAIDQDDFFAVNHTCNTSSEQQCDWSDECTWIGSDNGSCAAIDQDDFFAVNHTCNTNSEQQCDWNDECIWIDN